MPFVAFVALLLAGALFVARRAEASTAPTADVYPFPDINMTRGERNNNPGNIRLTDTHWLGERADESDPDFEQFNSPDDGLRALALLLKNYQVRGGLTTVRQIVNRYAPPSENATGAYVAAVSTELGVAPDDPVYLSDGATLTTLVRAIIRQENGRVIYADSQIANAVARV